MPVSVDHMRGASNMKFKEGTAALLDALSHKVPSKLLELVERDVRSLQAQLLMLLSALHRTFSYLLQSADDWFCLDELLQAWPKNKRHELCNGILHQARH